MNVNNSFKKDKKEDIDNYINKADYINLPLEDNDNLFCLGGCR